MVPAMRSHPSLRALGLGGLAIAFACSAPARRTDGEIRVECRADLGLGPADAETTDWAGRAVRWSAHREADRLTLARRRSCGDECNERQELVLEAISSACPRVVSARVVRSESGEPGGRSEVTVSGRSGVLRIQDWEPAGGAVSGRLEGDLDLTFYVVLPR